MKRFFVLSVLCLISGSSLKATEALTNGEEVSDTLFYQLQAIEVVASRASGNTEQAGTEISEREIRKSNIGFDLPSLLSFTPSLVSTTEGGTGIGGCSMRIRGTDATRINVSLNGMPLNNPDSHSMYWYDTPDLAGGSDRIQIVRGAGTNTAGTASFGGAVNISSASLKEKFCADASLSFGSFNSSRQSVHIGSGLLKERWIVDLRLSHISSDGYIDRASSRMGSYMLQAGWFNGGTMLKFISFGGKSKSYLCYNGVSPEDMADYGRTYHTSGQYVTSDGPFVLKDGTHVNYFDDQTDNYLQFNNQLILDSSLGNGWKLNSMVFYTYGNGYYRQYKDDAWLCGYNNLVSGWDRADLIRRKEMLSHSGGANINALYECSTLRMLFGAASLFYGSPHYGTIDWVDGKDKSLYDGFRWYDNKAFKSDVSLLAKADFKPMEGLNLHTELQYRFVGYRARGSNDNYDWSKGGMQNIDVNRTWHFLNPNVSASYTFGGCHKVQASFALAHKEPTRSDFTDRYQFSSIKAVPEAEKLLDWEFSYNFQRPVVQAGVNFYYMKYKDQLIPTGIVNDSEDNLNMNVDNSYRRGIEFIFSLKPCGWFELGANCTLSQNKIRDFEETIGDITVQRGLVDIAYSPSVLATVLADFHSHGFEGRISTRYVGKQYISNGSHDDLSLDGYFVGDIDLGYDFPGKIAGAGLRLALKISNFTNSLYSSYGYGASYMDGNIRKSWCCLFPQAPCNIMGSILITL